MNAWQNTLSTIFELAVTFLVPAVVWLKLIAGLYQLIRDRIHQLHLSPRRMRPSGSKVRRVRIGG